MNIQRKDDCLEICCPWGNFGFPDEPTISITFHYPTPGTSGQWLLLTFRTRAGKQFFRLTQNGEFRRLSASESNYTNRDVLNREYPCE